MLGNDCQTTNPTEQHKILFALKGFGNLGRPLDVIPLIMDCVTNGKHINISIAAIKSMRKMSLSEDTRHELAEIMGDQNADLEKRVEVFNLLMQDPSEQDIIFAIDIAHDLEDMTQLRSYISTYLKSAMQNKLPSHKK